MASLEASSAGVTKKDGSLGRKQRAPAAVPIRTREEIEAETRELN